MHIGRQTTGLAGLLNAPGQQINLPNPMSPAAFLERLFFGVNGALYRSKKTYLLTESVAEQRQRVPDVVELVRVDVLTTVRSDG